MMWYIILLHPFKSLFIIICWNRVVKWAKGLNNIVQDRTILLVLYLCPLSCPTHFTMKMALKCWYATTSLLGITTQKTARLETSWLWKPQPLLLLSLSDGPLVAVTQNRVTSAGEWLVARGKVSLLLYLDSQEIMMDHALRTISYIADIGDLVVLMARRRFVPHDVEEAPKINRTPKMICHVFESEEVRKQWNSKL